MTFEEHKKAIEKAGCTFYQMIEKNPYMTRDYLLYCIKNSTIYENTIIDNLVNALNDANKEGYSFKVSRNKFGKVFVNLDTCVAIT